MARSPLSRPFFALVSLLAVVDGAWVAAGPTVARTRQASDTISEGSGVVTATWIGPYTGGLWSDAANWDTTEYPDNGNGGLTYDVVIEFFDSDARYNVINLDTDAEINTFVLRRAALDAQSGPANLIINSLFEWGGHLHGPGTTEAKGGIIHPPQYAWVLIGSGHILENAGDATFTEAVTIKEGAQLDNLDGGTINIQTQVTVEGAQFNNLVGGTINIQASSYLPNVVSTVNGGVLNNFGLLGVDPCCPRINGVFNNHGSVDVRTGTSLTVYSTGTHSGEFHVADGATLSFGTNAGGNDFTATSNFTGLGNIVLIGGTHSTGIYSISGDFDLTGKLTASEATVNFASAPASPGFALELTTSGLSSFVSFDAGLAFLNELILSRTSVTGLHIVGDTVVSGPVQWEGTMSGPGTTTADGLVTSPNGLALDGRTLIANGGFLWQGGYGGDFLLDNGAVLENAAGSTFEIDLTRRLKLITTSTPENPGRIVNSGLVTQTQGDWAQIMTDWRQTSTGVTDVYRLYFRGNTDISGTVIVPASTSLTFAGPDTGATINHRLNPDSTITALGTVNVGDPSASGTDIIIAEFAGVVDFSDPNSSLNVYGANTTLILPFGSGGGVAIASDATTGLANVSVNDGTLVFGDGTVACCFDGGFCRELFEDGCEGDGGTAKARGSKCFGRTCPEGGACCFDWGCRLALGRTACIQDGGRYQGDATDCLQCMRGACCLPDSSCAEEPRGSCLEDGGSFLANVWTCEPNPCSTAKLALALGQLFCGDGHLVLDCTRDTSTDGAADACDVVIQDLDVGPGDSCTGTGRSDSPSNATVTGNTNLGYGATLDVNNIFFILTGPADFYGKSIVVLGDGASLDFNGEGQPGKIPVVFGTASGVIGNGDVWFNFASIQVAEKSGSLEPVVIGVPATLSDVDIGPYNWWSGGNYGLVFNAGLTMDGPCSCELMNVKVNGLLDATGAQLYLDKCNLALQGVEYVDPFFDAFSTTFNLSSIEGLAADGTSLGEIGGSGKLVDRNPNDEKPAVQWETVHAGGIIRITGWDDVYLGFPPYEEWNGMSAITGRAAIGTLPGIGTLTMTSQNVVIEKGSVLIVDIDPVAVDERNDRLEIVATTATFDASLEISIASGSECSIAPTDAFAIVTGDSITYPSGGDGRRILTTGGEGSFAVNQSLTGIVLDGFSLAGDGDGNGAVDGADTLGFVACMSGPGDGVGGGCDAFDFNGDGHADMMDFAALQNRFGSACP